MTYTGKRYGRFAREVRDTLTGKLCVVKGPFVHSADDSRFAHEARVLGTVIYGRGYRVTRVFSGATPVLAGV